ncbi:hypothetical protein LEP1GSC062_2079 [Leptospira alexanderi serovar Manhao 3 str. L 60]|uniref:Uncharacterized protein n=1 Tax=Leptospira alexanderi serovar Manhao 3 str. L 60 TaxID=1049759 RepID=V6HW45_9LEPT|nr:hypothetical protein LEP1GSC062_2079 [Leptospira alexanderi serovar Manhao 3 str. L 60]
MLGKGLDKHKVLYRGLFGKIACKSEAIFFFTFIVLSKTSQLFLSFLFVFKWITEVVFLI